MGLEDQLPLSRPSCERGNHIWAALGNKLVCEGDGIPAEEIANVFSQQSFSRPSGIVRIHAVDGNQISQRGENLLGI